MIVFCPCLCDLLSSFVGNTPCPQKGNDDSQSDNKRKDGIFHKSGNQICDTGSTRNQNNIWQLCGYVIHMITLCSGRCHDRRIGNRRTMVSTDSSGHTCGNRNNHHLGIRRETVDNNRYQNTKGSPRSTG